MIKKYIPRKCLEDKVMFIGDHCMGNCSQGPNLFIGDKLFEKILDEGLKNLD